jgi:hypothetical protein
MLTVYCIYDDCMDVVWMIVEGVRVRVSLACHDPDFDPATDLVRWLLDLLYMIQLRITRDLNSNCYHIQTIPKNS